MPRQIQPGDVLVSISNGGRGDGTRVVTLNVEDEETGMTLVNVDMAGEQFAAILGSHVTRVSGARIHKGA